MFFYINFYIIMWLLEVCHMWWWFIMQTQCMKIVVESTHQQCQNFITFHTTTVRPYVENKLFRDQDFLTWMRQNKLFSLIIIKKKSLFNLRNVFKILAPPFLFMRRLQNYYKKYFVKIKNFPLFKLLSTFIIQLSVMIYFVNLSHSQMK